jgi:hypothetical protein
LSQCLSAVPRTQGVTHVPAKTPRGTSSSTNRYTTFSAGWHKGMGSRGCGRPEREPRQLWAPPQAAEAPGWVMVPRHHGGR